MPMKLSHYTLKNISTDHIIVPDEDMFELPEKVLQFGTGMLLRGLPDYFIDKANRQGLFNGRIVVVKSTKKGDYSEFEKQDGLYTICERGIMNGEKIETDTISSSISRVLNAQNDWEQILECAHNPEIKIIISNTTEMGIQLVKEDIRRYPPQSFPGKLLAFLHNRFMAFHGAKDTGFVIVPTELVPENGKKLESIILELAHLNGLDNKFIEWLEEHNYFCNSLVDRIVTGMPKPDEREEYFNNLGYRDELLIVSEKYCLWAIEGDEHVKEILSFYQADEAVKIEPDIELYRELKLRLLNGTHTLTCGISFLAGLDTVRSSMESISMSVFLEELMHVEIGPSIPFKVDEDVVIDFTQKVLDRFRNPHIHHYWKTIAQNYSEKMRVRCIPLLLCYYEKKQTPPPLITFAFAAYIYYMKAVKMEQNEYFGNNNGNFYRIEDEMAAYFFELWKNGTPKSVVGNVLSHSGYWNSNLNWLPGFNHEVLGYLNLMMKDGMKSAIKNLVADYCTRS